MSRPPSLATVVAVLALVLPACGSASDTTATSPRPSVPKSEAQRAGGGVALKKIGSFDAPVFVTAAPGFPQLLFVVEQPGRVVGLRNGPRLRKPFLDLRGAVAYGGERGLLSVAFPPDYARSKRFYVYYTDNDGNIRIDEFKRGSAVTARRNSRRQVIVIPHPVNANHNGGQLQFNGNLLYFGTGDGGSGGDPDGNAQNKDVLLGKLLRIDPRRQKGGAPYGIPNSNPFVGKPGQDEIYSYGLRNPFRFSFDRVSTKKPRLVIADVGQNRIEEIDYTTLGGAKGANFGWNAFEGFSHYQSPFIGGTTKPVFAYSHDRAGGSCSVIGGYVAGRALPGLRGSYVYADLCEGQIRALRPKLGGVKSHRKLGLHVDTPTTFGQDDRGRIYVASGDGPVYRLVARR